LTRNESKHYKLDRTRSEAIDAYVSTFVAGVVYVWVAGKNV